MPKRIDGVKSNPWGDDVGVMKLVAAIAVVAFVGVGAWVWRRGQQEQAADDDGQNETDRGDDEVANDQTGRIPVVEFEQFATELKQPSDPDDERRLMLSFSLEVRTLADRQLVIDRRAEIRDKAVEFFMDRLPESVEGAANLDDVKTQLRARFNDLLPGEPVQAIYFDDFVVQ